MAAQNDNWLGHNVADRFHILKPLKEGGMAYLYLAQDLQNQTTVVLKTPKPALMAEAEFLSRFAREVKALTTLIHPNIVPILDSGEYEGLPFFVLKYLPNGTVRDRQPVDEHGVHQAVSFETLITWLGPVADALDYLHKKNLIHRDIKPDNILFDEHDTPYLCDFGIMKLAAEATVGSAFSTQLTQSGMVIGTPQYMAPELIAPDLVKGRRPDGRVDQYALGVTLFELIAGEPPIADTNPAQVLVKVLQRKFRALGDLVRGLSPELTQAVTRALAIDPNKRFPSCRDFANAVMKAPEMRPARPVYPQAIPVLEALPAAPKKSAAPPTPRPQSAPPLPTAKKQPALVRLRCPSCLAEYELPRSFIGQPIACSSCKRVFTLKLKAKPGAAPTASSQAQVDTTTTPSNKDTTRKPASPPPDDDVPTLQLARTDDEFVDIDVVQPPRKLRMEDIVDEIDEVEPAEDYPRRRLRDDDDRPRRNR
jgi:serine/threonine protein kinase